MTREHLQSLFLKDESISQRLVTLAYAESLNPDFKNPHIMGGYLRNLALGKKPNDCDVVFKGVQLNQPGILEAVREAELDLKIPPFPDWEFENSSATGFSGDFYEDNLGKYSHHTDYLTMLMMDCDGNLYVGRQKTLEDLANRVYDLHFPGVEIWATHRGGGRSYESCITGDLIRAFYMCQSLDLQPSLTTQFMMRRFDDIFNSLSIEDQQARLDFWLKKTHQDPMYQPILDKYGIKTLQTGSIEFQPKN